MDTIFLPYDANNDYMNFTRLDIFAEDCRKFAPVKNIVAEMSPNSIDIWAYLVSQCNGYIINPKGLPLYVLTTREEERVWNEMTKEDQNGYLLINNRRKSHYTYFGDIKFQENPFMSEMWRFLEVFGLENVLPNTDTVLLYNVDIRKRKVLGVIYNLQRMEFTNGKN